MSNHVFIVSESGLEAGKRVNMKMAAFEERRHLQEWLVDNPDVIEPGFYVLTSEFDGWEDATGNRVLPRLDILGLDSAGDLVVVELKRGPCPDATDMQALKYAALASRFTVDVLLEAHQKYLEKKGETLSLDTLRLRLSSRNGVYDQGSAQVGNPRVVIIAESFPAVVTSTVIFLCSFGIKIKLMNYGINHFETMRGGDFIFSIDTLYPIPGVEQLIVSPRSLTIAQSVETERATQGARQRRVVEELGSSIPPGTQLMLVPPYRIDARFAAWLDEVPERKLATWTGDAKRPLKWMEDEELSSPTGLVKKMYAAATGDEPPVVRGTDWWTLDGRSLVDIAKARSEGL